MDPAGEQRQRPKPGIVLHGHHSNVIKRGVNKPLGRLVFRGGTGQMIYDTSWSAADL